METLSITDLISNKTQTLDADLTVNILEKNFLMLKIN